MPPRRRKTTELLPQRDPRASLDRAAFLAAARPVLQLLTDDLLERADASPSVTAALRARHGQEREQRRTADPYEVWRRSALVQVAAAWLLSCVFVRTLEDRGLLARPRLAGPGAEDSQRLFGELAPFLNPRDYLLTVFRELARLPATAPLFDTEHNLVWRLAPSAGGAQALLDLFRAPRADAPAFRFGQDSTRFLGDLYQDLSDEVRERYALLQTPDFIEDFILARTLDPALATFGFEHTHLIDPTCGSGHFLLGAFARLLAHVQLERPGLTRREHANLAIERVFGVDLNPYAVAIARFRLTLAYWQAIGLTRLTPTSEAPPLGGVVVGDSLLYNAGQRAFWDVKDQVMTDWYLDVFSFEDERAAKAVLSHQFAAVVGNPPYITVKDEALREQYREMYPESAAGKYALSAPFMQRFFQLARPGGFVGQITANSFMKREFGKKLVELFLPTVDINLIVNTASAYIPGHGTPTVLVFGRNHKPEPPSYVDKKVLAVLGKRGEPSTPEDPSKGLVWSSIAQHWHDVGFDNEFITVEQVDRASLAQHPWSLEGGGAGQVKEILEQRAPTRLGQIADSLGVMAITGEDSAFVLPFHTLRKAGLPWRRFVVGESNRDWATNPQEGAVFPYSDEWKPLGSRPVIHWLWPYKAFLEKRIWFGKTQREIGLNWFEFSHIGREKIKTRASISYAFVASHNHFSIDSGECLFNRTAPVIKLPATFSEEDHLALLAYLNSSVTCFLMKQICVIKGMHHGSEANSTPFLAAFEFDSGKLHAIAVPSSYLRGGTHYSRAAEYARALTHAQASRSNITFRSIIENLGETTHLDSAVEQATKERLSFAARAIAIQEEIDWLAYRSFGLISEDEAIPAAEAHGISLGERPFEILLGKEDPESTIKGWFRWHASQPASGIPQFLPETQRRSYARRLARITQDSTLRLLETPMFKRRWIQISGKAGQELETDRKILRDQAEEWLIDEAEILISQYTQEPFSVRQASNWLHQDPTWLKVHAWLCGQQKPSIPFLIENSVPFLAAYRYSDTGLEKRALWEKTWDLQRREDAGEKVGEIPVPPKYDTKDFRDPNFYRLRGKLDVPKERFISYPGCESDVDGEPVYGWVGWDHLQRAHALTALYSARKDGEGWTADRLTPLLAGLLELLPWLKQWHNEPDEDGERMGDSYEGVLREECRALGLTFEDLRAWRPTVGRRGRAAKPADEADAAESPKRRGRKPGAPAREPSAEPAPGGSAPPRRGRKPKAPAAPEPAPDAPPAAAPAPAAAEAAAITTARPRTRKDKPPPPQTDLF